METGMSGQGRVPFAGDLFLRLAAEGRLVLDADEADRIVAELEMTLEAVDARIRLVDTWRQLPPPAVRGLDPAADQFVEAVFVEQVAPGLMEQSVLELTKYVAAFKLARRCR
jgi:hypothetical protein